MAIIRIENLTLIDVLYFFDASSIPDQYVAFRFIRMDVENENKVEGKCIHFHNRTFIVSEELSAEDMNSKDWIISKTKRVNGKIHFDIPTSILTY